MEALARVASRLGRARARLARALLWPAEIEERPLRVLRYRKYLRAIEPRRALVSYLPQPLLAELRGEPVANFSNSGIARAIPRALNELGFLVDIVSYDDDDFGSDERYDVLVQHGGINFDGLSRLLKPGAAVIYFSTGNYWRYNNEQAARRMRDFEQRHGVALPLERAVEHSEDAPLRRAAGTIAIGDETIRKSYRTFPLVLPIDLAVYPDERPESLRKDFEVARNHFFFYAGVGNVHKGLDLVLDVFEELSDQHLFIGTWVGEEFARHYREALLHRPNIHDLGVLPSRSTGFYEAIDRCAFVILPSCSEGQPGSVLECMNHGLVPVVSSECHLDTAGYTVAIEHLQPTEVRRALLSAASLEAAALQRLSQRTRERIRSRHTPERFLTTLRSHLELILASAAEREPRDARAERPPSARASERS